MNIGRSRHWDLQKNNFLCLRLSRGQMSSPMLPPRTTFGKLYSKTGSLYYTLLQVGPSFIRVFFVFGRIFNPPISNVCCERVD